MVFCYYGKEMRKDANISRAKWHLWPWKRSVKGKMRSVFTMKFSCSLAKSQESRQMSLKRSWWFWPLFFVFFLLSLFFKLEFPLRRITSLHQTPFSSCIYIYNPRNSLYLATSFTRTFFLQVIVTNERTWSWMENQCFDKWNKLIYDVDTLLLKGKKLSEWWLLPFSSSVCSRSQATRRWRSALLR